ncbi:MAG: BMP family ABC transporter substrate-binding protein [Chloroflexi bacterium]|nr:BMP family ABC transporter substrate-binding protein [Chloroflexota bacterium]
MITRYKSSLFFRLAIPAVILILILMPGCSGRKPQNPKAIMVTSIGGPGDSSFIDSAYRGLLKGREFGFDVICISPEKEGEYAKTLMDAAGKKPELVVALGSQLSFAVRKVAKKYPDVKFALVDGDLADMPNVMSIRFHEEEGAFLAGALAGATSRRKTVGFLGGADIPVIHKFESGFRAGVMTTCPGCKVISRYTGSFSNTAAGKKDALELYNDGADIIFHASGKSGLGAIEACKEKGKGHYIIGVDTDQDALAPGIILTSVIKRTDSAVYHAMENAAKNKFKGGIVEIGIKEDGVSLSPMEYTELLIGAVTLKHVLDLSNMIKDGSLKIPTTSKELEAFKPPALEKPPKPGEERKK